MEHEVRVRAPVGLRPERPDRDGRLAGGEDAVTVPIARYEDAVQLRGGLPAFDGRPEDRVAPGAAVENAAVLPVEKPVSLGLRSTLSHHDAPRTV
jgi:hypothetical protein